MSLPNPLPNAELRTRSSIMFCCVIQSENLRETSSTNLRHSGTEKNQSWTEQQTMCTGYRGKYSRIPLIRLRLIRFFGSFDPDWISRPAPMHFYGPKLMLFRPQIGLSWLIRSWPTWPVSTVYGDPNSDPFSGSICLSGAWGTMNALNTHHLPSKNSYVRPALERFSSKNRSSRCLIMVFVQF